MFLLKRGEQEEEEEARGASPVNDAAEPEETARRRTEGWGGTQLEKGIQTQSDKI